MPTPRLPDRLVRLALSRLEDQLRAGCRRQLGQPAGDHLGMVQRFELAGPRYQGKRAIIAKRERADPDRPHQLATCSRRIDAVSEIIR
jgi:hypothetical protein